MMVLLLSTRRQITTVNINSGGGLNAAAATAAAMTVLTHQSIGNSGSRSVSSSSSSSLSSILRGSGTNSHLLNNEKPMQCRSFDSSGSDPFPCSSFSGQAIITIGNHLRHGHRLRHFSSIMSFSSSTATTGTAGNNTKPVALFLNSRRLDYDHQLNWDQLEDITVLHRHDVDKVSNIDEMVELVCDKIRPEIIITKEMLVPSDAVTQWSTSTSSATTYEGPKLLCEAGTGYNNLPLGVCQRHNIIVCNVPTYSTEAVAHTAVTYVMNFSLSLLEQQRRLLYDGDRSNFTSKVQHPLHELSGQTIGLVGGAGRIGTAVAHVCLALGMNVIISSRSPELPDGHSLRGNPQVRVVQDIENDLLPNCDYVSLHAPLNDQTRGSFGREQIKCMKPTAYLINTSRGAVIREDELIDCMRNNVIAGAGLDVQSSEPPPSNSELWDLPNVFLSPHIGWRRIETRQRLVNMTCDNIRAYIKAKEKQHNDGSNQVSPDDCINVVNK
jgi:glycerate dehydrogenase